MRLRTQTLALLIALMGVSDGLCRGLIDPTYPNQFLSENSSLAVGSDGAFYVADGRRAIRAYDASGHFRFEIPNTATDSWIEVDQSGSLLVARNVTGRNGGSFLSTYSNQGDLQSERQLDAWTTAFAIGPGNVPYVAADSAVWRVPPAGEPTPYLSGVRNLQDMQFLSDGRLITWKGSEVNVFDSVGSFSHEFFIAPWSRKDSTPTVASEVFTSFAATDEGIFLTGDLSGTVRKYSIEGRRDSRTDDRYAEQIGVGYGVPLTSDLYATTDGALYAVMPDARVVERIGPERFDPNYVGVTRLRDRPPLFPDFYDRLLENGVDLDDGWSETTAPTFIVPGEVGEHIDLDFHYVSDTGSSRGVVFVYDASQTDADPLQEPAAYFLEVIDALIGFAAADQRPRCHLAGSCEGVEEPNRLNTLSIAAGTEIGFLNYSGNWSSQYAADPFFYDLLLNRVRGPFQGIEGVDDPAYIDFVTNTLEGRTRGAWLLSSDPAANWGRMDQFVSFLSDDGTLFGVEDLNLAGESDAEFTDFMFRISTRLIPTPEPSAALLSLLSLQLTATVRGRA